MNQDKKCNFRDNCKHHTHNIAHESHMNKENMQCKGLFHKKGHCSEHEHHHGHHHGQCKKRDKCHKHHNLHGKTLVLRPQSGISGDMLLSGLATLSNTNNEELQQLYSLLKLPVEAEISVNQHSLNDISGYKAEIRLPHEHAHRTLQDISTIITQSDMSEKAKNYALEAFSLLAEAEAKVHGKTKEEVHFHEVGALDSIVDTCICAMLFDKLKLSRFICGPLPLADGMIKCAHGLIPSPAPAVLHLLKDVQITQSEGKGEMITPTALSLLKAFKADFGTWPNMIFEAHCIVYGSRIIPNIPNGAIFALGKA